MKSVENKVLVNTLCGLLAEGQSENAACGQAGLHPVTYSRWMQRGYNDIELETPYGDFYLQVQAAKGHAEQMQITKILDAKDWKAAAWHLERAYRESWGEVRQVNVKGENMAPEDIASLRQLPPAEIERILASGDAGALERALTEIKDASFKVLENHDTN